MIAELNRLLDETGGASQTLYKYLPQIRQACNENNLENQEAENEDNGLVLKNLPKAETGLQNGFFYSVI